MKPENNPPLDLASPPRKVKSFIKAEQLIFALSFAGDYRKIYCNNFYCNIIPISVLNWLNIFSSNPAGSSSKVKLVRKVPFNWMQISQPGKVCRWRRNVLLEEKDWNIVSKNTELVRWGGWGWPLTPRTSPTSPWPASPPSPGTTTPAIRPALHLAASQG